MRGRVDRAMGGGDSGGGEGSVVDKTKGEGEEAVEGGEKSSGQSDGKQKDAVADEREGNPTVTKSILSVAAARKSTVPRSYNMSHKNSRVNWTMQWVQRGSLVHLAS